MTIADERSADVNLKIVITRSCFGNFSWDMFCGVKKISSSPMFTRKENCMKIVNKLARALRCPVKYIDLEKDYEL